MANLFLGLLALLGGVITLLVVGSLVMARRSLPAAPGGRRKVSGLSGEVDVRRDRDGVVHIFASDAADAYFALGFCHAEDRMWQMEFQRRSASGRVAEILGKRMLPLDRFMRTLELERVAEASFRTLPAAARVAAISYAAGVNAWMADRPLTRMGPEFLLFRRRPAPWKGEDVVLFGKLLAFGMCSTYMTELLRHELAAAVGAKRAAQLMPDYFDRVEETSVTASGVDPKSSTRATALSEAATAAGLSGEGHGSNSWAVRPSRSVTGGAVLANDPHLPSSAPLNWYLAHLSAPTFDVIGGTMPGVPFVLVGRNREIAWGLTNLSPDVQDLFREELDPESERVRFEGAWEPLQISRHTLAPRGGEPVELVVRRTRHGPLISEAISQTPTGKSSVESLEPLAFSWTGLAEDDTSLEALRRVNVARNWDEFRRGLEFLVAPAVCFTYADAHGHVGQQAAGRVPVRRDGDGSLPAEGWSGEQEWEGFLPFADLPSVFDPPEGYVATINQPPTPPEYEHLLGRDWVHPYREQRIREWIEGKERMELEDHFELQIDQLSLHGRELLPLLLPLVRSKTPRVEDAMEVLGAWDFRADGSSVAASIFAAWILELPRLLLADELEAPLLGKYLVWTSYVQTFVERTIRGELPEERSLEDLATRSLEQALDRLEKKLGSDRKDWRWERLHAASFPHYPLHGVPFLRRFFSRSSPRGGDWSSVNLGTAATDGSFGQRNIPGYRQVIDLSRLDGGSFIQALGQSGHFLSRRYDDFLPDWEQGALRPMRMQRSAVEDATIDRWTLAPEGVPNSPHDS